MHRIIFQTGLFIVYSYGLCVAVGFLLAAILIVRDAKGAGVPVNGILDCLIAVFVGGIIGGRLLFVIINREYYLQNPARALMFYEGGLAFQGAFILAVISGMVAARLKKISFLKAADLIAPYIFLGQAFGRLGCFLNGCCYGRVTNSGFGVIYPGECVARIPVQAYSSLILFILFAVLLRTRRNRTFDGYVFALYIILYSVFRFFMDFLRGDNLALIAGIRISQLISITMFIAGIVFYAVLKRREFK
ncbi:MAG: prolipoprotein diacylglyceryl transferase [Candidatus Omnitrophota bacterium]